MRSPDLRPALSYMGNLLSRVSGVETFRETRTDALAAGLSLPGAVCYGTQDFLFHPIIPTIKRREESAVRDALKIGIETYVGIGVPLYVAYVTKDPALAIATRIAYHFAVEIIPDALRAIRRNFHLGSGATLAV